MPNLSNLHLYLFPLEDVIAATTGSTYVVPKSDII